MGDLKDERIVVKNDYGGMLSLRTLRLIRVPKNEYGAEWKLDPDQVKDEYGFRYITRNQADGLLPLEWKQNAADLPPRFLAGVRIGGFCLGVIACILMQCLVSWIRRWFRKPLPGPA